MREFHAEPLAFARFQMAGANRNHQTRLPLTNVGKIKKTGACANDIEQKLARAGFGGVTGHGKGARHGVKKGRIN